ncbi:MAG: hypothetical protein ACRDWB_01890 [Acidimicrobiales bacterium]
MILVSRVVPDLSLEKDFHFKDRGAAELKGFDEPIQLFEVNWN